MFNFSLDFENKGTKARAGLIKTNHGIIETPVFMPVGTKGIVRAIDNRDLAEMNAEIILANTYHLEMRPGTKFIEKREGLHAWINWNKPILTDSGGFQVFSLKHRIKINDEGVEFQSHLDGSKHFFSPKNVIYMQKSLGADIIMPLDECITAESDKDYAKKAMIRTHKWAEKSKKYHKSKKQALFGIIQGNLYDDLRIESAKYITNLNFHGNAIGGLSVGESKEKMHHIVHIVEKHLPKDKPRYLMGVGTPEDLLSAIDLGMDMFDSVLASRLGRHGAFFGENTREQIKNKKFKIDKNPLKKACQCYTCQLYSKSYIRHLMIENDITGHRLLTIHNLHFLLNFMHEIRSAIGKGQFLQYKKDFLRNWTS